MPGVVAGDAGVVEDQVGIVGAADRDRAVERDLAPGLGSLADDQQRLGHGASLNATIAETRMESPETGLEPATPSLPWRCSTS